MAIHIRRSRPFYKNCSIEIRTILRLFHSVSSYCAGVIKPANMADKTLMDMPGNLKMPTIGLGTGSLSEEAELEKTLDAALDIGYRHIDTAFAYDNEAFIGRVLQKWFSSGKLKREDIFITTKLPMYGVNEDRVELFMKKSLENLQLDYVDLYLVHFPIGTKYVENGTDDDNYRDIDVFDHLEIWKRMEEQVDAGRTKTIGLSNFNQSQIEKIMECARIKPACLQVELHVDFQQRDLVEFCHQNDIVVVAYSPLGSPGPSLFEPRRLPPVIHNESIKRIADKYSKSPGQVMLRYLLQKDIVAVPKSSSPERLKENFDVYDFEIDSEDMTFLDDLEAGSEARTATFKFIPGIEEHPEYPFEK